MRKPGLDQDFESFRRSRPRKGTGGPAEAPGGGRGKEGKEHVWEALEAQETQEQQKIQLTQEVDDFFVDATKLAANIVQKVAESREQEIDSTLRHEMEDFLLQTIQRATNVIRGLGGEEQGGLAEVEVSMKNLIGAELDRFRAEGTAQLDDKHLGQDPFDTELTFDHDADEDDDLLVDGGRIQLSDNELAVDFSQPLDEDFMADEFGTTGDTAQDGQQSRPGPEPAAAPEPEEDAPLAEMYAQPAESETADEVDLEDAPYPDMPSEAEVLAALERQERDKQEHAEEPAAAQPAPPPPPAASSPSEAARAKDRKKVKAALSLLVRQGVMSKDEAREAYRRQISE